MSTSSTGSGDGTSRNANRICSANFDFFVSFFGIGSSTGDFGSFCPNEK